MARAVDDERKITGKEEMEEIGRKDFMMKGNLLRSVNNVINGCEGEQFVYLARVMALFEKFKPLPCIHREIACL